ncbi:MAG: hypothetical protein ABI566_11395 [Pseudolysinimonas sp.]
MVTTSLRTYRYLRIALGGMIIVIFVSVAIVAIGRGELGGSISGYYYTPARSAFVGALIAAAIALLALSGHRAERALLDGAGLLAPLIAVVATPIRDVAACGSEATCVPEGNIPGIENGVLTFLIIGTAGWLTVVVLLLARKVELRVAGISLAVAAVILAVVAGLWFFARPVFLSTVHFGAAAIFFLLIGTIAVLHLRGRDDSPDPAQWMKIIYGVVGIGMAVVVVLAAVAVIIQRLDPDAGLALPVPPVLACEVAALVLFLVFWVVQSIQRWDDERAPALAA